MCMLFYRIVFRKLTCLLFMLPTFQLTLDGAASQFKQKYNLYHMSQMQISLGLSISWYFFATSHGKGVVDGLGGTAKRMAMNATKAQQRVSNCKELHAVVARKMPTTRVVHVPKTEIDATTEAYLDSVVDCLPIPLH